jgi:hypothetical protein
MNKPDNQSSKASPACGLGYLGCEKKNHPSSTSLVRVVVVGERVEKPQRVLVEQ